MHLSHRTAESPNCSVPDGPAQAIQKRQAGTLGWISLDLGLASLAALMTMFCAQTISANTAVSDSDAWTATLATVYTGLFLAAPLFSLAGIVTGVLSWMRRSRVWPTTAGIAVSLAVLFLTTWSPLLEGY